MGLKEFVKQNIYDSGDEPTAPQGSPPVPTEAPTMGAIPPVPSMIPPPRPGQGINLFDTPKPIPIAVPVATPVTTESTPAQLIWETLAADQTGVYNYVKFRGGVRNLKASLPDEKMAFQVVFNSAAVPLGVGKEALLNGTQEALSRLQAEREAFAEGYQSIFAERISKRENEIQAISDEILRLSDLIKEQQAKLDQEVAELEKSRKEVENTKTEFELAAEIVNTAINGDILKINQYIPD